MADAPSDPTERLRRAVRAEWDEALLERAVERGILTAEDLARGREAPAAPPGQGAPQGPSIEALVASGLLDRQSVIALGEELLREEMARPSPADVAMPPEVAAAATDSSRLVAEFVLVAPLGRGSAGEVWKAWDRHLGRWVAVKISTIFLESAAARERFAREATAASRLSHPNVVPIFRVGADRGRPFLVMALVEGETLERLPLPSKRAIDVVRKAAIAIDHAHRQGVIHRDIKPGNIMVDRADWVFVLDFGLAHLRSEHRDRVTQPGDVLGTVGYMAPEQARGDAAEATIATDVYGLGATLYRLVTGRPPFQGASMAEVVRKVLTCDPVSPRRLDPTIGADLEAVLAKALDKAPARRYSSAAVLADDLGRLLAGQPVSARLPSWRRTVLAGARRHRLRILAGALGCLLVAAVAAGRVRLARERHAAVTALRELASVSLSTALRLRRSGQHAEMRALLPQLAGAYARVKERAPSLAEAEYLMGRMYRALLDEERALAHQEAALRLDPKYGPALYERVVLLSARYGRELGRALSREQGRFLDRAIDPESVARRKPALAELGQRVVADCDLLSRLEASAVDADAARGIADFHRHRHEVARETLGRVVKVDPSREEVWETLGRTAEARSRWQEAEQAYVLGARHDPGYVPHRAGLCRVRRMLGRIDEGIAEATAAIGA